MAGQDEPLNNDKETETGWGGGALVDPGGWALPGAG